MRSLLPLHTSVPQRNAACSVCFSLHTSVAQSSKACGVFFPLHTSVSQSSAACSAFFFHFTLQYHKVAKHVEYLFYFIRPGNRDCGGYGREISVASMRSLRESWRPRQERLQPSSRTGALQVPGFAAHILQRVARVCEPGHALRLPPL